MTKTYSPEPSRRGFLTGTCAIVGLSVGAVLLTEDASATPGNKRLPDSDNPVTGQQIRRPGPALPRGRHQGAPGCR
ncbi:MAG: twin-arginine translocation signal domain-containing protein [Actinobacteria bacterium]|nr:twin-arginine translocation signal domain-containing protein [Actinomycetota bacterium]